MEYIKEGTDDRIFAIAELFRKDIDVDDIYQATKIDPLFLNSIKKIIKRIR